MTAIVADKNIEKHVGILIRILQSDDWIEWWVELELSVLTFEELGLLESAPDDVIWRSCQRRDAVLITNNRNADGPHSLEATIRAHGTQDSYPVFTLAKPERIANNRGIRRIGRRISVGLSVAPR